MYVLVYFCYNMHIDIYIKIHLLYFVVIILLLILPPPTSTLFPYTTVFRSICPTRSARTQHAGSAGRSTKPPHESPDRKSTRLNSSHVRISYAVFCLKKKKATTIIWA